MFEVIGLNQKNPFSFQLFAMPNIVRDVYLPTPNVSGGPSRVGMILFSSMSTGGGTEESWFKVYNDASPDPLSDGPDIALPFSAGADPVLAGMLPGVIIREGDANGMSDGAYFDAISVFASQNPGTDETENPITAGPCIVGLIAVAEE